MKKVLGLLALAVLGIFGLAACTGQTYEIALITDVGNIDDESFNQGAWEGVVEYAEENEISYEYFQPSEDSNAARIEQIENAIDKGAKIVVCPGYLFETAIYEVQNDYPDVAFLLLDGEPHDADYNYETADNVHNVLYKEEQSGFLAGYGAVMDGYRELGFVGGMAVPAVVRFGYGYIQGADYAAQELGLDDGAINIKYYYADAFEGSAALETKMDGWYEAGTEVVFACGGGLYTSVVAAAENTEDGKVIGVDVDQGHISDVVITSAMKNLTGSVVMALEAFFENDEEWPEEYAGETAVLGVTNDGVGLPTNDDSWRFDSFTVSEYEAIFQDLVDGEVTVSDDTETEPTTSAKVTVDYDA
jgi:basic membrane protein A